MPITVASPFTFDAYICVCVGVYLCKCKLSSSATCSANRATSCFVRCRLTDEKKRNETLTPSDIKIQPLTAAPSALATGTYLSPSCFSDCLSLSWGTCEAGLWERLFTAETDVTSCRAGVWPAKFSSCLRRCSLEKKSLKEKKGVVVYWEIRCSVVRAAAWITH